MHAGRRPWHGGSGHLLALRLRPWPLLLPNHNKDGVQAIRMDLLCGAVPLHCALHAHLLQIRKNNLALPCLALRDIHPSSLYHSLLFEPNETKLNQAGADASRDRHHPLHLRGLQRRHLHQLRPPPDSQMEGHTRCCGINRRYSCRRRSGPWWWFQFQGATSGSGGAGP